MLKYTWLENNEMQEKTFEIGEEDKLDALLGEQMYLAAGIITEKLYFDMDANSVLTDATAARLLIMATA